MLSGRGKPTGLYCALYMTSSPEYFRSEYSFSACTLLPTAMLLGANTNLAFSTPVLLSLRPSA